jgi:hypothetical protein
MLYLHHKGDCRAKTAKQIKSDRKVYQNDREAIVRIAHTGWRIDRGLPCQ